MASATTRMETSLRSLKSHPKYHHPHHSLLSPKISPLNPSSPDQGSSTSRSKTTPPHIVLDHDPRTDRLPVLDKIRALNSNVDRLDTLIDNTAMRLKANRLQLLEAKRTQTLINAKLQRATKEKNRITSLDEELTQVNAKVSSTKSRHHFRLELTSLQHELQDVQVESARLDEMQRRAKKLLQRKKVQENFTKEVLDAM